MNATRIFVAFAVLAVAVGCNEKKQTYTEAVQLYEMETAELLRLEARRVALTAQSDLSAGATDQLKAARDLLGANAGEMQKALREATGGLINPEDQKKADKAIEDNLKLIDQQIQADAEKASKPQPKSDESLEELDSKIAKQKERVEAARKAKEALAP
jgi:hypothetical protein